MSTRILRSLPAILLVFVLCGAFAGPVTRHTAENMEMAEAGVPVLHITSDQHLEWMQYHKETREWAVLTPAEITELMEVLNWDAVVQKGILEGIARQKAKSPEPSSKK